MPALVSMTAILVVGATPDRIEARQSAAAVTSLVFEGATVVDVEQGKLVPDQRVVIVGNRIQAVGTVRAVKAPMRAQVVDARDKYLIPGLWDMHAHVQTFCYQDFLYPWLIVHGVTGINDLNVASISVAQQLRREVAAGTRVGPRTVISGPALDGQDGFMTKDCAGRPGYLHVATPTQGRHVVDSLQAAGADMLKMYRLLSREVYFAIAAEARRVGIPIMGHRPDSVTFAEASDSGQRTFEHPEEYCPDPASAECAALMARLKRNGTWVTPTLIAGATFAGLSPQAVVQSPVWPEIVRQITLLRDAGIPLMTGTDLNKKGRGVPIQDELYMLVSAGLTPLEALRAATLNPAEYLGATDSLGRIGPGQLADVVLLDADPLAAISNTTKIHAVVANGQFFDRPALDALLAQAQEVWDRANGKKNP